MLKKGRDGKLVMMYVDYTTEFPLPNRNLGLYAVDSLVFDLQRKEDHSQPAASVFLGDDPIPEGPAFNGYIRFDQALPS